MEITYNRMVCNVPGYTDKTDIEDAAVIIIWKSSPF